MRHISRREAAAIICSKMASVRAIDAVERARGAFGYTSTAGAISVYGSDPVEHLAWEAFNVAFNAITTDREKRETWRDGVARPGRLALAWAEAEAMLRTGWTP